MSPFGLPSNRRLPSRYWRLEKSGQRPTSQLRFAHGTNAQVSGDLNDARCTFSNQHHASPHRLPTIYTLSSDPTIVTRTCVAPFLQPQIPFDEMDTSIQSGVYSLKSACPFSNIATVNGKVCRDEPGNTNTRPKRAAIACTECRRRQVKVHQICHSLQTRACSYLV